MTKPRVRSASKKDKKPSTKKEKYPSHSIPRSKLDAAIKFLEEESPPKEPSSIIGGCFRHITLKQNYSRTVDNYQHDTSNILEVARQCAQRGRWPELVQTFAIMMESVRRYELPAALRNSLFAIIADPALNDPSFLEAYLYSNPYCTNENDFQYCVNKILEVFQGVTIHTTKGKGTHRADEAESRDDDNLDLRNASREERCDDSDETESE